MKRLIYSLVLVFTLAISANTVSAAGKTDKIKTEMTAEQQIQLKQITDRVQEIRAMDKSQLTKTEKKELRKELRGLKNKQMR
ncbi:hypothetical protein [Pedobacter steynii]